MRLHSRGTLPSRLDSPPLSDEAWNLIRSCWVREASKRPRIEAVAEKMAVLSQPFASTCASAAQHTTYNVLPRAPWSGLMPQVSTQTSATAATGRPGEELALHYSIPTSLPPPLQPTTKGYEKQREAASLAFDSETLRTNYVSKLHEKSTGNTMTDDPVP